MLRKTAHAGSRLPRLPGGSPPHRADCNRWRLFGGGSHPHDSGAAGTGIEVFWVTRKSHYCSTWGCQPTRRRHPGSLTESRCSAGCCPRRPVMRPTRRSRRRPAGQTQLPMPSRPSSDRFYRGYPQAGSLLAGVRPPESSSRRWRCTRGSVGWIGERSTAGSPLMILSRE